MALSARCIHRVTQMGRSLNVLPYRCFSSSTNKFGSPLPAIVESHGWDAAWKQGVTPWDAGKSSPMLHSVLARKGADALPEGDVLVPGCGSGYDALTFGLVGRRVLGLDLSPTALARANVVLERHPAAATLQPLISYKAADFFAFAHKPFSVIWDYTFAQALPPALRHSYAASAKRLLAPGGQLAFLMFPVEDFEGGPPFALRPPALRSLLAEHDFECIEETPVPDDMSFPARRGREVFCRFQLQSSRFPACATPLPRPARARK